jgi:methylaspartate ammonia-lyase
MEIQHIQTLGQKLAFKDPSIQDYACNVYADKIAMLDLAIENLENLKEDPELIEALKNLRENLLKKGLAIWIMKSDVLTNLGIKVGKTGIKEYRGKKEIGNSTS